MKYVIANIKITIKDAFVHRFTCWLNTFLFPLLDI